MINRVPAEVFPPGDFIREELEERGWSQAELAEILDVSAATVSDLSKGKRSVTPEIAKALEAALEIDAEYWLRLDAYYRLHTTPAASPGIKQRARLHERFPIREMIGRGWLVGSKNSEVLETQVLEFFGIDSLDETPELPHAAKKSKGLSGYDEPSPTQLAWLYRVKRIAETMQVPLYTTEKLRDALDELKPLMMAAEEMRHVPRILAKAGIRFVIVEHLPRSKIDGVCFWLNKGQPVIGMSLRLDRIDNFWFVLRHEIEHVLNQDASLDSELDKRDPNASAEEQIANDEAAEFCVSIATLGDFIARVDPLYSHKKIVGFANIVGVHPGVLVGQLQRRIKRYDLFRTYLVKVRDIVTPAAMTDGYGRVCPA